MPRNYVKKPPRDVALVLKNKSVTTVRGCVEWTGCKDSNGYGVTTYHGRRMVGTHRVAWELQNGPIPPGMCICHHCDNPPCINVNHMFVGTAADNVADKIKKGRQPYGEKAGRYAKNNSKRRFVAPNPEIVQKIRESSDIAPKIARELGMSSSTVHDIKIRRTWKHVSQ